MSLGLTFSRAVRPLGLALAVGAAALLTGCVVAPLPAGYAEPGPVMVAPNAPPPLYAETIPVAPAPSYIWINGFWDWGGGRYAWRPGYWSPPRPGYGWAPREWAPRHGGGWQGRGGHWERRR